MAGNRLFVTAVGLLFGLALRPASAGAQGHESAHPVVSPSVLAVERRGQITLDGRLDEPDWVRASPATDFRQSQPNEGAPAAQRTEVRFLFDADALYIGARMYDSLGAAGVTSRLVRRDQYADADWLTIVFDTFHDHLGRTRFEVNPAGVKRDAHAAGDYNPDESWDPVWQVATHIDSLGWTAEIRIPFSQLRFRADSLQTWGMQIVRLVNRTNERSHWAFWRQNEAGGPSRYGHLEGLTLPRRTRRVEALPYVVTRAAHVQGVSNNDPFRDPTEYSYRIGGDVKFLVSSNLTLDAAINPDFGQVEVDPAVVNLSAFETFLAERRPFFIEGAGIFSFGGLSCYFCSNVSSLSMFYTRRIGRRPQGTVSGDFVDMPENTTILGAAKLTGRTANGYSIGVMNAVTRQERASVQTGNHLFRQEVEPLSNYFVGRVKRDLRGGNLILGGILTSVYRNLDDSSLVALLNRRAEAAGADMNLSWGQRRFNLMASIAASRIAGDSMAIQRAQLSSARYFQRPDREQGSNAIFSNAYDPGATSMTGYGGYARLAKVSGDWQWETAVNFRSPGFENNDLAFLTRSDYVWMNANLVRQFTRPTNWYRSLWISTGGQQQFNYSGDLTDRQAQFYVSSETPGYWWWSTFYIRRFATLDDRLTRGGPVVGKPGSHFFSGSYAGDSRKKISLGANADYSLSDAGNWGYGSGFWVEVKPASNVQVTVGPQFSRSSSSVQYVTVRADETNDEFFGYRYIFADLVQRTLSMNTRINVTFTPSLSLELFAQPLISGADYERFKEFESRRDRRMRVFGPDEVSSDIVNGQRQYTIDPDGPGAAAPFSFADPNFNFRSLRGNAVFRWEYRPGSTLFVVWTQQRQDFASRGDFDFGRDRNALFAAKPDNILLVKMNYWLRL